jgi:Short C-terminal domain
MRTGKPIGPQCMVLAVGLFSRRKKPTDDELAEIPPEAAAIVEQLTEMFPGASVSVDEPVAVNLDALRGDDRISQLERLAKLREQGALTESEFQAEKARILGES